MSWLFTDEGYYAVGYDEYFMAGNVPVWSATGKTMDVISVVAVHWVLDAVEVDGNRRVVIYYVDDSGQINGTDIEIRNVKGQS